MKNATAFYLLTKDILLKNITAELEKSSELILIEDIETHRNDYEKLPFYEEKIDSGYFKKTIVRIDLHKSNVFRQIVVTCYDYELDEPTDTTLGQLSFFNLCQISDRFSIGGDSECVEFQNSFKSWTETFFEMSIQVNMIDSLDKPYGLVKQARQENGYNGLIELTTELTDEFQNTFGNELWIDKDFRQEILLFATEKLHIGMFDEVVIPIHVRKLPSPKTNQIPTDIDKLLNGKDENMFSKCKLLKGNQLISTLNLQKCIYFNATIVENIYDAKQFKIKTMTNSIEIINYSDVLSIKFD